MNNEGERSKALVVRLGIMTNKLTFYRYGIPKTVVAELVNLRREMHADRFLRISAPFYFEMLDGLFQYTEAKNAGQNGLADAHMAKVVAKWNEIDVALMEVTADGS